MLRRCIVRCAASVPQPVVHGVLPPLVVPYTDDGAIDFVAYRANVARLHGLNACSGFVVGGSNGEYTLHSDEERVACVRSCRDVLAEGHTPVVAGCGTEDTASTIRLGAAMLDAGATALLVLHPSYFKASMHEDALLGFYRTVAAALDPAPLVVYNMPANTGIDLSAKLVQTLMLEHSNIVGFKDSGGNLAKMASVVGYQRLHRPWSPTATPSPPPFGMLAGSAGFLLPALSVGAVGGVCAYANLDPVPLRDMMGAVAAKNLNEAAELQCRVVDLNTAVTAQYGVPGLKYCMWRRRCIPNVACRAPLLPLSSAATQHLDGLMERAQLPRLTSS